MVVTVREYKNDGKFSSTHRMLSRSDEGVVVVMESGEVEVRIDYRLGPVRPNYISGTSRVVAIMSAS